MSDNTTLPRSSGDGDTFRNKDRSGVKTQVVGLDINIGGVTEGLMQAGQQLMAASVPVVLASDQTAISVAARGATTGGLTIYRLLSAATTNAASVKGSAGQVYGWYITNTNASA